MYKTNFVEKIRNENVYVPQRVRSSILKGSAKTSVFMKSTRKIVNEVMTTLIKTTPQYLLISDILYLKCDYLTKANLKFDHISII